MAKHYTKNDIEYIKTNYGKIPTEQIAATLGFSDNSIQQKAWRLSMTGKIYVWSPEDIDYLIEFFYKLSNQIIANHLNRSQRAIIKKYYALTKKDKSSKEEQKMKQQKAINKLIAEKPKLFKSRIEEVLHEVKQNENYYPIFKR